MEVERCEKGKNRKYRLVGTAEAMSLKFGQ